MFGNVINLRFCSIEKTDFGCSTRFPDMPMVQAWPHAEPHYYVIAHRCGYSDDLLAYCREHEFAHAFVAQELMRGPSAVLLALAKNQPLDGPTAAFEECMAQTFQRWMRASEEPILSGVDWHGMKSRALNLLESWK